jgi:4-diphosphocytidyl-2-C-methyl-D-erythritol kinase
VSVVAARVAAQAKVNLMLRVGERRRDGYHEVATILARIELADDVVVRPLRSGLTLTVAGAPTLEDVEQNLASRAARAYMEAAHWPPGCGIHIEKRIPLGAGLGGGSSDAGAVLRALDSLSPRPLGMADLAHVGASLGADVPFFTHDMPMALGTGRGDMIEEIGPLPPRWLALVMPSFAIATRDAYAWLDIHRVDVGTLPWPDRADAAEQARQWTTLAQHAVNDFETVIHSKHPEIAAYRDALRQAGAFLAMMSGSGSAVFGVFDERPDAGALARACNAEVVVSRVPARVVAPPGHE